MWFRSTVKSSKSSDRLNARTSRRQLTRLSSGWRSVAGDYLLEPLEDRRMLSFTPGVDYSDGNAPFAIVTADFNADGRLDLATASADVSVLLGNSDGSFQPAINTSSTATSLAVGDFNADGKLDLVTVNASEVRLLLGNGDGSFQTPMGINIGLTSPSSVAVGDFNADGKLDLGVTSNLYSPGGSGYYGNYPGSWTGVANVLLGNGAGSFGLPSTSIEYDYITNATLADFNSDGKLDFAVTHQYGAVSVLPGTGSGTLGYPIYTSGVGGVQSLAVGDVNGDGKLDLVTASQTNGNNIGIFEGVGDGTFALARYYTAGAIAASAALGDFNGDSTVDLATTDSISGTVNVLLGAGAGTFRPPVSIPAGANAFGLAVGDFNRDGRPDVATANLTSNTDSVLLNDGIWPALDVPSITISDATVTEGNTGTVAAVFTVSLSAAYSQTVSVRYATRDDFATVADGDYQARSGTLTFAPGQTSQTFSVLVNGDRLAEFNETFSLSLTEPSNAFLADALGAGTILDDEPYLSISSASGPEGNTGTTPLLFTVTLSAPSDAPVTVAFATSDTSYEWSELGRATADVDYQATTGILTFAPGETSKTITVLVNGDRIAGESSEYFFMNLESPDGAGLIAGPTWGEIQDDEPNVSIGYANAAEGDGGITPFVFTINLSAAYDAPIVVGYGTSDGSASAGSDYVATSGTVTFAPGETSKTLTVLVNGDTLNEGDEYFNVNLIDADRATIYSGPGYGTIINDDDNTPQISISDVSKSEGNSGKTPFVFTVSLSAASSSRVSVHYATAKGSATANGDYQSASGNVIFAAGQTSKTVTVQVKGDTNPEPNETFFVNLSGANGATIADGRGTGTIVDDDAVRIRISDLSKPEGNSGTTSFVFTVSLSAPSSSPVTVNYATANGTAKTSDNDYNAKSGKLTFAPGETAKTITIAVKGDKKNEAHETFFVNLAHAKGALLDDDTGVGTILNDDTAGRNSNWIAFAASLEDAMHDFLSDGRRQRGR